MTHDDQGAESRLPVVSTGQCTTSHHACDCVLERLRQLNEDVACFEAMRDGVGERIADLEQRLARLEAERVELMAFAESESKDWHGRNADRYWEVQRFLARLRAAQVDREEA